MLVSGSYAGWMVKMMREMFVGGRLKQTEIKRLGHIVAGNHKGEI